MHSHPRAQKHDHVRVAKDVYSTPSWILSFKGFPIGYAHSKVVVYEAARIAERSLKSTNPSNLCPSLLIKRVAEAMSATELGQFWTVPPVGRRTPSASRRAA